MESLEIHGLLSLPFHPSFVFKDCETRETFSPSCEIFFVWGWGSEALEPWPCQSPSSEELKVSSLRDELVQEVGRVGPWGKDTVGTERPSRGWAGASGSHGCRLSSLWPGWLLPGLCLGGEVA